MPMYLLERREMIIGQPPMYAVRARTAKRARRYLVEHERHLGYAHIDAWKSALTARCAPMPLLVDPEHDRSRR